MVYAPLPALYCEMFPTAVRYSGISIGYQMASILLASFTPALASAMVLWAGGQLRMVIAFAILTTLIAMVAISFAPDRRHLGLDEIDAELTTEDGNLPTEPSGDQNSGLSIK